jgi:hypothetical protein
MSFIDRSRTGFVPEEFADPAILSAALSSNDVLKNVDTSLKTFIFNDTLHGIVASALRMTDYLRVTMTFPPCISDENNLPLLMPALTRIASAALICTLDNGLQKAVFKFENLGAFLCIPSGVDIQDFMVDLHRVFRKAMDAKGESDGFIFFSVSSTLWYAEKVSDAKPPCEVIIEYEVGKDRRMDSRVVSFFKHLSQDITLCRGARFLSYGLESLLFEIEEALGGEAFTERCVFYIMFRADVDPATWWRVENVPNICGLVYAEIQVERSMYLMAICSRPNTTGAVSRLLKSAEDSAVSKYGMQRLYLFPATDKLHEIYARPEFGFSPSPLDPVYMEKFIGTGRLLSASDRNAFYRSESQVSRRAGGRRRQYSRRRSRSKPSKKQRKKLSQTKRRRKSNTSKRKL